MIYQARRRLPALLISPKIYHCSSKLASILYYVCTILLKSRDWNNEPELPVCLWGPDGTDYSASEVPRTGGGGWCLMSWRLPPFFRWRTVIIRDTGILGAQGRKSLPSSTRLSSRHPEINSARYLPDARDT